MTNRTRVAMNTQAKFDFVRRAPARQLAGQVVDICAYRELNCGSMRQRETSSLVVPVVFSLGTPFRIALRNDPTDNDAQPSFAAGLFAGPVEIASDGAAECVQVNFTPLGAYRFFGGAAAELCSRMVDLESVAGPGARRIRDRIAQTQSLSDRLELAERFIAARLRFCPSSEIAYAYRAMANSGGAIRIARLAGEIGWSRKHFAHRFAAEIGLAPKTVARMMRFASACRLARRQSCGGWAEIAAEAGYADQPHLVREFTDLAGESPLAWARRMALMDPKLALEVR